MKPGKISVIVVGVDFSPASNAAFDFSIQLAEQMGAEVIAVFVKNADDLAIALRQHMPMFRKEQHRSEKVNAFLKQKFDELAGKAKIASRIQFLIVEGIPWKQILKVAKASHANLIVTGTRSRSSASRFFLGSTAEKLIVNSYCPVLTANDK